MEAYQVLHIPTGEYVSSKNRANNSVLFSDAASAQKMIYDIVNHKSYICGAPLEDYLIGPTSATQEFYSEEFECIPVNALALYPPPRLLTLA